MPVKEVSFLVDQRHDRKMLIGVVDRVESERLTKLRKRNIAEEASLLKRRKCDTTREDATAVEASDSSTIHDSDNDSESESTFNIARPARNPNQNEAKAAATR